VLDPVVDNALPPLILRRGGSIIEGVRLMMKRLLVGSALFLGMTVGCAWAGMHCYKSWGGGYSCYDYSRGSFISVRPRVGGGYTAYDSKRGATIVVTPKPGGGFTAFDYGRGAFIDISPDFGGGYHTFDYGTGKFGRVTPWLFGNGFSVEEY